MSHYSRASVDELVLVGRHAEIAAVEPETLRASSLEPKDVAWAEASREVAVFPRQIEVEVRISRARVVSTQ